MSAAGGLVRGGQQSSGAEASPADQAGLAAVAALEQGSARAASSSSERKARSPGPPPTEHPILRAFPTSMVRTLARGVVHRVARCRCEHAGCLEAAPHLEIATSRGGHRAPSVISSSPRPGGSRVTSYVHTALSEKYQNTDGEVAPGVSRLLGQRDRLAGSSNMRTTHVALRRGVRGGGDRCSRRWLRPSRSPNG